MGFHGVSGRVNLVIFLHIGTLGTVPQDVIHHEFSEIRDHQPKSLFAGILGKGNSPPKVGI